MKRLIIALVIIVVMLCTSCVAEIETKETDEHKLQQITLSHSLSSDDEYIGSTSINSNSAFYTLSKMIPLSNYDSESKIVRVNLDDKEEEIIYQKTDEEGFFITELLATENYLFWQEITDQELLIKKINLDTMEVSTLSSQNDIYTPILFATDGNYLTWYVSSIQNPQIHIYNIEKDESNFIEGVEIVTPYERVALCNGKLAYISGKDSELYEITIYDLNKNEEVIKLNIKSTLPLTKIHLSEKYITYMVMDTEVNYSLYAYDYINDKAYNVNGKEGDYIFNYALIDDKIIINDKNENDIIMKNIEDQNTYNLSENIVGEHSFYSDTNVGNLYYVRNNTTSTSILFKKL